MSSDSEALTEIGPGSQAVAVSPRIASHPAVLWGFSLAGVATLLIAFLILPGNGHDAFAYWRLPHAQTLYGDTGSITGLGVFRYSPTFALAVQPLSVLPWDLFRLAGTVVSLVALAFLCRGWALAAICLPPVMLELYMGNIHLLLAATLVLALRWPAMWSLLLLTKVTPGVGLLYLAGAGRWRQLTVALAATAALVIATVLISGTAVWSDWATSLSDWQGGSLGQSAASLAPRLVLAAGLALWGGRTAQPWTVPVAATLALPVLWTHGYAVLLGALPLLRHHAPIPASTFPHAMRTSAADAES